MIQIHLRDSAVHSGCRIAYTEKKSIMDVLIEAGVYVSAICGGNGTCGKCKIRLIEGELPVTAADKKAFSQEELDAGMRLSCVAYPTADVTISLEQTGEEDFMVLGDAGQKASGLAGGAEALDAGKEQEEAVGACYFAIDIGTTTLAISLVREKGTVVDTYTSVNHQRMYGADVISRIQASNDGHGPEMTASIKKDLQTGMFSLLKEYPKVSNITRVVIAGNTTMGHLLMGYDCESLGHVPFTPVNINRIDTDWESLFGQQGTDGCSAEASGEKVPAGRNEGSAEAGETSDLHKLVDAKVIILPGFTAFVGGDITSGLLAMDFDRCEKPSLFIDLGTNGEMAIGNKDKILVASTAAGPAFEAGNISCGMGSVAGAICSVDLSGMSGAGAAVGDNGVPEGAVFETLGGKPAKGICGTGVIEVTAELIKAELLDETGLLDEEYFDDGFPMGVTPEGEELFFEQSDVRQLQLAKAAVRGGVETLMLRYGVTCDDIDKVYLAGGFGVHLNVQKALTIGLLPEELDGKIEAVGNTSLLGAICYGCQENGNERIDHILECASEVDLSSDKAFQEFYVDAMFFE